MYFDDVWSNVELYLLGCRYGVAIVEGRYKPELNPNVAMEWGWMRGLGKDVLFLVEKRAHKYVRADWSGLIRQEFSWNAPRQTCSTSPSGTRDSTACPRRLPRNLDHSRQR
jgi:nucleoside 2-deoxyribosyltransferase